MTTNNREDAERHRNLQSAKISPRILALWVGVVAVGGVATFAWHAQGQQEQAPNTLRFLQEYAAAKNTNNGQVPARSFESIGAGDLQSQPGQSAAPANTQNASTSSSGAPAQLAPGLPPSLNNGQSEPDRYGRRYDQNQQIRVAEVPYGPLEQGPSLGPAANVGLRRDQSILRNAGQDPNASNFTGSAPTNQNEIRLIPPPTESAGSAPPFDHAPAPVGGYGQAGSAVQPQTNSSQQPFEIPPGNVPLIQNEHWQSVPVERDVPVYQEIPSEQIPNVPPESYGQGYSAPVMGPQHVPHSGLAPYRPFANAGTGPTQPYGQGAYVSPGRTQHVADYRLRVDDVLDCVYRMTRDESSKPYELNVGDTIRVESLSEPKITRELIIQPDGTVSLLLLGQVRATRQTVEQFRRRLEELYREYYRQPDITITPLRVNTKLLDVINTVDSRAGSGGQVRQARVAPDGTISLPAVGKIPVQGMSLDEVKREIDARYSVDVEGVEVTPILVERAKRYVYVLGEAKQPNRYELLGPTNVMQAVSLAGGWNVGANLRQVIILRRGPNWRVQATMIDVWDALYGNRTCPIDDIWLADSDVVIIPKMKILVADDFIDLIFTRGIYGILPFQGASLNFAKLSSL